jgi:hypothetical protein
MWQLAAATIAIAARHRIQPFTDALRDALDPRLK